VQVDRRDLNYLARDTRRQRAVHRALLDPGVLGLLDADGLLPVDNTR
jgi:hypothetical protein